MAVGVSLKYSLVRDDDGAVYIFIPFSRCGVRDSNILYTRRACDHRARTRTLINPKSLKFRRVQR